MCAQIFTGEESDGRNGGREKRERERKVGAATVGQGGKETRLYQPKGEEKTTGNDGEERIDGEESEEEN